MATKIGRPKVAEPLRRAEFLSVRLRPGDKSAILRAARRTGEPHTVWIRNVLLRAARRALRQ